jgi:hypothetical protein
VEQLALIIVCACLLLGGILRILGAVGAKCGLLLKPPLHIQLVPVDDPAEGRFAESHRHELESLGFNPIGTYRVREMPGVTLVAFTQSFKAVCAVVYRHPLAGVFADMCSITEDNRSFTVTNAPAGGNLDQPPGHQKAFEPKAELGWLYDRVLSDRPAGPYQRLDTSNFTRMFEEAYDREMKWRLGRGGVTEAEVRREAHAMGIHSEKKIQKATENLRKQYSETSEPGVR